MNVSNVLINFDMKQTKPILREKKTVKEFL